MATSNPVKFVFRAADAERVIVWPCVISVPQDGGVRQDQTLDVKFRVLASDEAAKYFDVAARAADPSRRFGNIAFVEDVVAGFPGFSDETGAPVADADARASLFSQPYVVDGIVRGYFDMTGNRLPKN